jgi:hypothetical protein
MALQRCANETCRIPSYNLSHGERRKAITMMVLCTCPYRLKTETGHMTVLHRPISFAPRGDYCVIVMVSMNARSWCNMVAI